MILDRARIFMSLMPSRLVTGVCTCGPVGYWGRAPGTNGSALGIALYTVLFFRLPLIGELLLSALFIGLAILFCDEGERRLQKRDPGEVIIDEVVAIPVCFIGMKGYMLETGAVWLYMLAGFGLFRLYDILKPFGIRGLQRHPGGIGVVVDDVAAAIATNLTLQVFLLAYALGGWGR